MNRNIACFFMCVFMCSAVLFADEPSGVTLRLSLRDVLTMALERHAQIIMADERMQQALARVGQSTSGLLPQLSVSVGGSRQTRDLRGQGIALPGDPHVGPFNAFDARIKMTQAIFDPAAVARLNAAAKGQELSKAEQIKVQEDVLALVATLYLDASRSAEQLETRRVILKRDAHRHKTVETQYREGVASMLDVEEAQSRYEQSYLNWTRAKTEEARSRLDLCAALDLPMEEKIQFINEDLVVDWDQEDLFMLEEHPDIQMAIQDLDWKMAQRVIERSQWLPKITALADYGASGESPSGSSSTYSIGLQATLPIWEGGDRENRIKEAASRVNESQIHLDDVERQTKVRVWTALETIKEAQAFIRQANAQLRAADRQARLAVLKLRSGQGSQQDVLDGRAQQANALFTQTQALSAYRSAQVNVAHALGRMEEFIETQ